MTTATPYPADVLEQRLREARLAEQRHQLLDPAEPPLACEAPEEETS